jgi:hypothetical protein
MRYTTQKIEVARGQLVLAEQQVAVQRRRAEEAGAARGGPAADAWARLLIMEQSLLAMARFLRFLERDLEGDEKTSLARAGAAARIARMQGRQGQSEACPASPTERPSAADAELDGLTPSPRPLPSAPR